MLVLALHELNDLFLLILGVLSSNVFEDDKGWILNIPHNYSYWGTYSIGGEIIIEEKLIF